MKQCRYCHNFYPEDYFGVALTTENKIYRRHKCKFCYQKVKNVLKDKYKKLIIDYKMENGCSDCGNKDYRVLEFHHLDKKQKDFNISVAYYNRVGMEKIRQEIKKCVILCANCHRITHWVENKW